MAEHDRDNTPPDDSEEESFLDAVMAKPVAIGSRMLNAMTGVGQAIVSVVSRGNGGEEEAADEQETDSDVNAADGDEETGEMQDADAEGPEDDAEQAEPTENRGITDFVGERPVLIGGVALAILIVFAGSFFLAPVMLGSSEDEEKSGPGPVMTTSDPTTKILEAADRVLDQGRMQKAEKLYRLAWSKRDNGDKAAIMAGIRLSILMISDQKEEEAAGILDTIRSRTKPGCGSWAYAMVGLTHLRKEQGNTKEYLKNLYKLRANAARYPGEKSKALRSWTEYRLAISGFLASRSNRPSDGSPVTLPGLAFGSNKLQQSLFSDSMADVVFRADVAEKIKVEETMGGVQVSGDGVSLGRFLSAMGEAGAREVGCQSWCGKKLYTRMDGVRADRAVDIVLGSVGLKRKRRGSGRDGVVLMEGDGKRQDPEEVVSDLERFVLLYPRKDYAGEAYYAMSCLHLQEGQPGRALNQIQIMLDRFPDSKWKRPANYLAGYVSIQNGAWEQAASYMRKAEEGWWPGARFAKGWMGHILSRMGQWEAALKKLKPVLKEEIPQTLRGKFTYDLAVALERTAGLNERVRELYAEARELIPNSKTAVMAIGAMARIAMLDRLPDKAAELMTTGMQSKYHDAVEWDKLSVRLVETYVDVGRAVQGVVSGMVMLEKLSGAAPYELVKAITRSCDEAEMWDSGIALTEDLDLERYTDDQRAEILMHKGEILLKKQKPEEALETLRMAEKLDTSSLITHEISACIGEAHFQKGNDRQVLSICRELLDGGKPTSVERKALSLLGRYYEKQGEYLKATRVYEGQYWVSPDWEESR